MNRLLNNPFGKTLMLIVIIATLITAITASCATTKTKTKTPLTQSNRLKIKNMAILVEADKDFNVSVEKHRRNIWAEMYPSTSTMTGFDPFTFFAQLALMIPATIVEIDKYHDDKKHEEALESELVQFSPDEIMSDRLQHYLASSDAGFTAEVTRVKSPDVLKANGFDTILEVNLRGFEVEPCLLDPSQEDYLEEEHSRLSKQRDDLERKLLQVGGGDQRYLYSKDASHPNKDVQGIEAEMEALKLKIEPLAQMVNYRKHATFKNPSRFAVNVRINLSGRMILIDDDKIVWEREELYKDKDCYPIEDLKTQPEILVDILTRAVQILAENTVNEIL
ncbi:MAG: hypothetical protein WBD99_14175 [Thermodesulfobacteriota bacterium]